MKRYLNIYLDSYRGLSNPAWMLALVMLLNRSGAMVIPFLGVYMIEELEFTKAHAGIVLTCYGIGSMMGAWFGGWLTDRVGHYKIQAISLFLSAPLFVLLYFLKSVETLAAGVMLLSLVYEIFRPANSVAITYHSKPENLTRAFSLNRMAINLGFSVGPALAGFLSQISYKLLFFGNGIALIIAGLTFIYYFGKKQKQIKPHIESVEKAVIETPEKSPYRDLWFMVFSVLCAFYAFNFFQLLNTLPIFYREAVGMNKMQIGMILAYSGIIVFSFEMLLVYFAEKRLTMSKTINLGFLLCGVSYMLLLFHSAGIWILYLSISILCFSEIFAIPFMSVVTERKSGLKNKGAYMGVNALAFSLGLIFAPFLGTKIVDAWGFDTLWKIIGGITVITMIGMQFSMKKMFPNTSHI